MVVSALDPDAILYVRHRVNVVGRQSLRLITCVRVWYTIWRITSLPSDELVVEVESRLPTWQAITLAASLAPDLFSAPDEVCCGLCKKAVRTDYGKQSG